MKVDNPPHGPFQIEESEVWQKKKKIAGAIHHCPCRLNTDR
jgi:hypothetical protein